MPSYEPLHHKYRPQTFADLVGQEAIATTLSNAIATQRIAPAYLFTGPRGTGKTSSARILAKSLNCLTVDHPTATPCGTCEVCRAIAKGSALDVIEIDAASNTGVDNIREIIERAQFAPVQCRYKVYVIDECHMLSVAAFNALLKTLEEPPERVIFILATTDPQRVLPTIISRCQRFDYRRIPLDSMVQHLTQIAQKEAIEIKLEALTLVAQIANGGLRDAESLLDQLSLLTGPITTEKVWDLVGAVPEKDLLSLLQAIQSNNPEIVIESCRHLMNRGREPLVVLQNLANFYLNLLIAKTAPKRDDLVAVTATTWEALCQEAKQWEIETILRGQQKLKESEVQVKNTTQPRLWLEVTLLGLLRDACHPQMVVTSTNLSKQKAINPVAKPVNSPQEEVVKNNLAQPIESSKPKTVIETSRLSEFNNKTVENPTATPSNIDTSNLSNLWQLVLDKLSPLSGALMRDYGQLISYQETAATIGLKSPALLKAAKDKLPQIEAAFEAVCGHKVRVSVQVKSFSQTSQSIKSKSAESQPPFESSKTLVSEHNYYQEIVKPETYSSAKKQESNCQPQTPISQVEKQNNKPEISGNQQPVQSQEIPDINELPEDNINKVAEKLAKIFDGEVISDYSGFKDENLEESVEVSTTDITEQTQLSNQEKYTKDIDNSNPTLSESIIPQETRIRTELNASSANHVNPSYIPPVTGRPEIPKDEEDLEF